MTPLLFKGRTDAGVVIEIRLASDGYDIFVDGARIDHTSVPWHLDPDTRGPVLVAGQACEETFDAPPEALDALRASEPRRWARELREDGLVDAELALTARGRRCLDSAPVSLPAATVENVCVLVADAARARLLALTPDRGLVEIIKITNPMLRARDSEVLSDNGSGRRGGARTPLHGTPDRRDHRRRDVERHFAARIAEEAAAIWRTYPSCTLIVAASPVMLGMLRPAIDRTIRAKDRLEIHEQPRDLTRMSAPMLQTLLADEALLPDRGRRPPRKPIPGLPAHA